MMLLLLLGHALASGLPQWPEVGATVQGECSNSFAIAKGSSINPLLIGGGSLALCSAVAEPLSSYAHLLAIEVHAKQITEIYAADMAQMQEQQNQLQLQLRQVKQRHWLMAVTVSSLVTSAVVAYSLSRGEQ